MSHDNTNEKIEQQESELQDDQLETASGGEGSSYAGTHVLYQDVTIPATNTEESEDSSARERTREG